MGTIIKNSILTAIGCLLLLLGTSAYSAETYLLPEPGNNIIGELQTAYVEEGDTMQILAERYGVGYNELINANPELNPRRLKVASKIKIPTAFILPNYERKGIIINLSEMRLYYFPPQDNVVITAPIAIGRQGWETPLLMTKIIEKKEAPYWFVPESIRNSSARKGRYLPKIVPPGPSNPLGEYALRLDADSYLIHGTNNPRSIGKQISSGCIRMYPEDIAHLFYEVDVGTPVRIINDPYKVGWFNGQLYVEAHAPIENGFAVDEQVEKNYKQLIHNTLGYQGYPIPWEKVDKIIQQHRGYPQRIL